MSKAVSIFVAGFLGLVVLFPLVGLVGDDGDGRDREEPAYRIPDPQEAPPRWNAQNLPGTTWEADMRVAPVDEHRGDLLMVFNFLPGGRVTLDIEDTEEPDPEASEESDLFLEHLRNAIMPQFDGTYTVDGHQIHVEVHMLQRPRQDVFEIRGPDLYYHGVRMRHVQNTPAT